LLFPLTVSGVPRIASYHADIHSTGPRTFTVDISIKTGGEGWNRPSFTLEHYPAVEISELSLGSAGLPGASWRLDDVGLLSRLVSTAAATDYTIRYDVIETRASGQRIPLAVPEIPTSGDARSVSIRFFANQAILGDSFPAFRQSAQNSFVAELSNVPAHVQIALWSPVEAGFRERWFTPATFSDLAVILLLALGSIARAMLRRRREV
jgi:hypothetical protein